MARDITYRLSPYIWVDLELRARYALFAIYMLAGPQRDAQPVYELDRAEACQHLGCSKWMLTRRLKYLVERGFIAMDGNTVELQPKLTRLEARPIIDGGDGRRHSIRPSLRRAVIERDGHHCRICGQPVGATDIHLDHIVQVAHGGANTLDNLRVTHSQCNLRRPRTEAA